MSYRLKNGTRKGQKMNLASFKQRESIQKPETAFSSSKLSFFPLSKEAEGDICQSLNKNIFHLEKKLAYFSFAVNEVKDITKSF